MLMRLVLRFCAPEETGDLGGLPPAAALRLMAFCGQRTCDGALSGCR
jgi:hypothetical protein